MKIVSFIFARGDSKGVPNKNIKNLSGKPLIGWAIEQAAAVDIIDRVIVSTDSEEIASVARKYGAEVPFIRPAKLAGDESSEWLAWRHALTYLKNEEGELPDIMVSVPATSPLRLPDDINNCIELYCNCNSDAVITVTEAKRSPWFNMVKIDKNGEVELLNSGKKSVIQRQTAPEAFDITTVAYAVNPQFVLSNDGLFSGQVRALQIPEERALDIDTMNDFNVAELLMNQRIQ